MGFVLKEAVPGSMQLTGPRLVQQCFVTVVPGAGVNGVPMPVEDLPPLSSWADDRAERRAGRSLVVAIDLRAEDKRLTSVAVLPVVDRLRAFNSSIRASLDNGDELSDSGSVTAP